MKLVQKYVRKNHDHMLKTFKNLATNNTIQATKVFHYIQNSFNLENFQFLYSGNNFFTNEQNSSVMEKVLESYYRQTQEDSSRKFYLYRVQFQYEQIGDIIEFWLTRQQKLKVQYIEDEPTEQKIQNKQQDAKQQVEKHEKEENQFQIENEKIPNMIQEYTKELKNYQEMLKDPDQPEQQAEELKTKINDIELKIKLLEQRSNINGYDPNKIQQEDNSPKNTTKSANIEHSEGGTSSPKEVNYRALFNYYAKQVALSGAKTTFEEMQNELKSINYQKLILFLKEFQIMPKKPGDNKKIHLLYIKNCDNSRTLSYQGFMKVLDGTIMMIEPGKSDEERKKILDENIIRKSKKNKRLNPFHSPEKQDFRIDKNQLTYNFKIVPQYGKFEQQVVDELEKRRKDKSEAKSERQHIRKQQKIRHLKKLQAIDPFNEVVLKNSKLLQEKKCIQSQPIASLENIEKYRDSSFDFNKLFGGQGEKQSPRKNDRYNRNNSFIGQDIYKKAERLQKYQNDKMKNLMNGIIQRSNAKMEKLGISPQKAANFY